MIDLEREQRELCKRYHAEFAELDRNAKLGISDNFFSGDLPLNGLRHPPERGTSGWYLWAGEQFSDEPDFFRSLHVFHLLERCPQLACYLGLAPGWRFLVAGEYEDVWYDEALLTC